MRINKSAARTIYCTGLGKSELGLETQHSAEKDTVLLYQKSLGPTA